MVYLKLIEFSFFFVGNQFHNLFRREEFKVNVFHLIDFILWTFVYQFELINYVNLLKMLKCRNKNWISFHFILINFTKQQKPFAFSGWIFYVQRMIIKTELNLSMHWLQQNGIEQSRSWKKDIFYRFWYGKTKCKYNFKRVSR